MNHAANLTNLMTALWTVLSCESTPAEMIPHITEEQRHIIQDGGRLMYDLLAPPKIAPAKAWRTPTEVRAAVAQNLKARSDQSIERKANGAVNVKRRKR